MIDSERDHVLTPADIAVCKGSGELRRCPFCGGEPISGGAVNGEFKNIVYTVLCTTCQANINACYSDTESGRAEARAAVVARWNSRA